MRSYRCFNNLFSRDRKLLYVILSIVLVLSFSLTIIYAALSTTLNINGQAEISAANWDIYLDNVQLNSNSATSNVPVITNSTTATFSTSLSKPGDFYEFTIDVVNGGSIDAVIDSVTKMPELSAAQAKYLSYVVEYQNGQTINVKQLVEKQSFVRLKVKVKFRNDISASDLPTQEETLNLSFRVNYVQSDDNSENVIIDNNGELVKIVSGDADTVGSEICLGSECFYVISSDSTSVTMIAKYNLYVGKQVVSIDPTTYEREVIDLVNPTGIQDSRAIGDNYDYVNNVDRLPTIGIMEFSSSKYWGSAGDTTFVYDSNSTLYNYVENYKIYLENQGTLVEEARLIKHDELAALGCNRFNLTCSNAPEWIYATSYWTGFSTDGAAIWVIYNVGALINVPYDTNFSFGVRPVIKISKNSL